MILVNDTLTAWQKHHTIFRHGLAPFFLIGAGFSLLSIRIEGMPSALALIAYRVSKRFFDAKKSTGSFPFFPHCSRMCAGASEP
jgi:hypothetical protein